MIVRRPILAIVAAAAILLAQTVQAEGVAAEAEPDHLHRSTAIVGIGPTRLVPTVLVVPQASAFGWMNYAAADARIEFDEDITTRLSCAPREARGRRRGMKGIVL